ncbi:MAG TPA: hypothetical protein VKY74_09815 [Chloroflexia bacterium]|nr:hypothetical protein [Chloroflexia bacterium]
MTRSLARAPYLQQAAGWPQFPVVDIQDITPFVHEQYTHVQAHDYAALHTPSEKVYPVRDPEVAQRLGLAMAVTPADLSTGAVDKSVDNVVEKGG